MNIDRAPALLVGLILCVYWARVMHLAAKVRRHSGHTANVIPPGISGRLTRAIWFPTVFLWIALPLATPWWRKSPPWAVKPLVDIPVISWGALLAAVAAFALTLVCWKKMGNAWRMGVDPAERNELIVSGVFARVRHPIYALSSGLMLATVAIVPSPLMIAVGAVHLSLLQLEARREERHLEAVHGAIYRDYCARTGRFIPRLGKINPPASSP
jgi:protein-S-isoprenylcysteine O-methyltransferase Ste14